MKFFLFSVLTLLAIVSCVPVQVAPTVTMEKDLLFSRNWQVAVLDLNYEFEEDGTINMTNYKSAGKDGGRVVANLLASELSTLDNFKMIERSEIAKLLDEQALQQSGIIDPDEAKKIGKMAGADAIILGDLTDYIIWENISGGGSTISFSIRMIDLQSGQVIMNAAISRARPYVDSFANVQLTAKEIVEAIQDKK
jgi:curli biogenesis system outer membrane secretion channel CsgG